MKKPAAVREVLTAAVPSLKEDPDKLTVFVDDGVVVATSGKSPSFEARYTLHAILQDFAGDQNLVFAALVEWIKVNQRELVENRDRFKDGFTFEVDLLNHVTCDLSIKLKLTEAVVAQRDDAGQLVANAVPEPRPEWEYSGLAK